MKITDILFITLSGICIYLIVNTLIEKKVLNFATAYNTGVLQYYLIYENFGSKLPHDTVIMGLLPANDFSENDGSRIKKLELNSPKTSQVIWLHNQSPGLSCIVLSKW